MDDLKRLGLLYPTAALIKEGGIANAASGRGTIAPGSVVSLYGSGFTDQIIVAPGGALPTTLGGITVYVNGFPAPLYFVSPGQINIQIPWELGAGEGNTPFTVMIDGPTAHGTRAKSPVNGTFTNTVTARFSSFSPGIHNVTQTDYTPVSDESRESRRYSDHLGQRPGRSHRHSCDRRHLPSEPASGNQRAPVRNHRRPSHRGTLLGPVARLRRLYQVAVRVPAGVRPGDNQMVISAGGEPSQSFTTPIRSGESGLAERSEDAESKHPTISASLRRRSRQGFLCLLRDRPTTNSNPTQGQRSILLPLGVSATRR